MHFRGLVGARLASLLMRAVDERDGEALHEALGVLSMTADFCRWQSLSERPVCSGQRL